MPKNARYFRYDLLNLWRKFQIFLYDDHGPYQPLHRTRRDIPQNAPYDHRSPRIKEVYKNTFCLLKI